MSNLLFLALAFLPIYALLIILLRRTRTQRALSVLPAFSLLLYALPYEGVLIAARFWQVAAASASGSVVLGVPLERLVLDGAAIWLASLVARWLWHTAYPEN